MGYVLMSWNRGCQLHMGGNMDYVVRGGTAAPDLLQRGYGPYPGQPGMYGLSVQYAPGKNKSLKELARAGRMRNGQISYALPEELSAALVAVGYSMQLVKTPGFGYHHTLCVVYSRGVVLTSLPADAAQALSTALHRIPNPALVP